MPIWTTIVNDAAGGGRCGRLIKPVLGRLQAGGLQLDVQRTTGQGHAVQIAARAYAGGSRHFIAVGGDGTAYEVINGLFPEALGDERVRLGCLPLGTGNSFLRDFGVEATETAIDRLLRGDNRACDVVRVTHADGELYYINLLSVGFSARVGALTNKRFKPFGTAGYGLAVVSSIVGLQHPSYPLSLDGDSSDARPCVLLSFSNSRFTGGAMMMAPDADPTDGELDVIRIGALSRLGLLRSFPKIYAGTHVTLAETETSRARSVAFHDDRPVDCMIDGEITTLRLRRLEVLPGALRMVL